MKTLILLSFSLCILAFSCKDSVNETPKPPITDVPLSKNCTKGKIVGQKCNIYALQVIGTNQKIISATDWEKITLTGETILYHNIIGLVDLPDTFKVEDKVLFLTLREPTPSENFVPCWTDLPPPPTARYVVIYVSELKCSESN